MSIAGEYGGCRSRATQGVAYGVRRRNYKCRKCGEKFQHDGRRLPVKARICVDCLKNPANMAEYQETIDAAFWDLFDAPQNHAEVWK